jgi:uncharacterized membrane protein
VLLAGSVSVLLLAVLPPALPEGGRAALMQAFAPVCHQLPARSPHLGGTPLAVCDRCLGIYAGLALGIAGVWAAGGLWRRAGRADGLVLLAAAVPMGADWIGPLLGLWANTPWSRSTTGLLFGLAAGSFLAWRLAGRRTSAFSVSADDE